MVKQDYYKSNKPRCPHEGDCISHPFKCGDCVNNPQKDYYEKNYHWRPYKDPYHPKKNINPMVKFC